jgi:hypothetical protein
MDMKLQIDTNKLHQAFNFLADTPEGDAALQKLRNDLNNLQTSIKPSVSRVEFLYIIQKLISQLPVVTSAESDGMSSGLLFQGKPGKVTHLTSGQSRKITPSGFVILSKIEEDEPIT